ncbi:hypothetical protein [Streptomyces luteolus]|uniref:Uncharacterized protein n=1 Tax=Streptomyces luteolus TaxID=3043615 RepID=A0ABT6SW17_9ACTN|nr:hypothetical protein [Streptomyces sp. B-S-A12]MDI3419585.1 hypothetical protein [Streptomyces sp. B-S-A12]
MPDMSASAAANLAMTHLVPLAKEIDEDKVTPGVLGFIVFAALAVGVWMLMKSMNRHMGRVNFEEAPEGAPAKGAEAGSKSEGGTKK